MLSLGGELTIAIRNGLKRSAVRLVEKEEDLVRLEKQLDEAIVEENRARRKPTPDEKDEILDELNRASTLEMRTIKPFPLGSELEVLSSNLLKKYIRELDEIMLKKGFQLEIEWIDESHGMFNTRLKGRVVVDKNGPIKLLIRKDCPKMAWFHENIHLDDLMKMGRTKYRKMAFEEPWTLEWNVWEGILKTRNKYREVELVSAYRYVKWFYDEKKILHLFKENKEMEQLIIKYQK